MFYFIIMVILLTCFLVYAIKKNLNIFSKFSKVKIKEKEHLIQIDDKIVYFREIQNIKIEEDTEEFSLEDRFFVKDTGRLRADRIVLELKNGGIANINTSSRKQVYDICKVLARYKKLDIDIDRYKETQFFTPYEFIAIMVAIFTFGKSVPILVTVLIIFSIYLSYVKRNFIGFILMFASILILAANLGEKRANDNLPLDIKNINYAIVQLSNNNISYLEESDEYSSLYNSNKKFVIYFNDIDCPYGSEFEDVIKNIVQSKIYDDSYTFVAENALQNKLYRTKQEAESAIAFSNICKEFCIVNPLKRTVFRIDGIGHNEALQIESILNQLKDW